MNEIIKILMERNGMSYEDARILIKETVDEIICNPSQIDEIIWNYLHLYPNFVKNKLEL